MDKNNRDLILRLIADYTEAVELELEVRWDKWDLDLFQSEKHEVIGALLARMVSLATELAAAPQIWNEHIAPLILRSLADGYISLAWILEDSLERSRKFVHFGLGQAKLGMEHRKLQLETDNISPDDDPIVQATQWWINSQRYTFLTEVDLGSWSDITTRKMAEEAGCIDFYNYVYSPFSAATHNMWHHIGRYNLVLCRNSLHGLHKIPTDPVLNTHIDYMRLAAKYVNKAFRLFDNKVGIQHDTPSAYKLLLNRLEELEEDKSDN